MADDGLFLANQPLLLDLDEQVKRHLDEWLNQEGMVECPPRALTDARDNPLGDQHHAFPLPKPNYPPAPPIGINQLYWPTGALRHSRGYFICSESDVSYFTTIAWSSPATTSVGSVVRKHVPLTFTARAGGTTFSTSLYMLAPRPLTSIVGKRLYLLPLVDARYWWTHTGTGSHPLRNPLVLERVYPYETWQDVWDSIADEIGPFAVSPFSDYYKPDTYELTRQFENPAHMLDVAAMCCGLRVVRDPDGYTYLLNRAASLSRRSVSWSLPHAVIAGDTWQANPMSERLQIMFQKLIEGSVDRYQQWWRVDIARRSYNSDASIEVIDDSCHTWGDAADPLAAYGVSQLSDVIYSTFHANFDHTRGDCPTNVADVRAIAKAIFKDHYGYQQAGGMDVTFAGIQPWSLSGFDDYLLFDFGTEGPPVTKLHAPAHGLDAKQPSQPPTLTTCHPRRILTRVRSMPPEFGIRHQLSQTDQVLRVDEGYFKIVQFQGDDDQSAVKWLSPGGWAYAKAVWYDVDNEEWVEFSPIELMVKLWDPNYLACGVIDEVLHAEWNAERTRWEIDRQHGLERRAVCYDSSILSGGSGTVTLWANKAETNPVIRFSAWLDWMTDKDVIQGTELLVSFRRDEKAWLITNAACGTGA